MEPGALNETNQQIQQLIQQQSSQNTLIAQLRAQISQVQGSTSSNSNPTTTSAGLSWNWLSAQPTVVDGNTTAAINWTTFNVPNLPQSATVLVLQVTARRHDTVSGEQYMRARAVNGSFSVLIYGQNSDGVDTDTEGSTGQFFVPCSGGKFQWNKDNGVFHYTIKAIAYLK